MIEDILKNSSLKNTRQRSNILKIIASSHKPVTAEEIFEILKSEKTNINLSTIYRTLNILCHKNLLLKVTKFDKTASYQLNDSSHKHYITCFCCHDSVLLDICPLKELSDKIANKTGYAVTGHSIELTGICPKCMDKNINENKK